MWVRLLYFGVLRDVLASHGSGVEMEEGATVRDLVRLLQEGASNGGDIWRTLAVAVNQEYASRDRALRDGDEVALLPPVSGGGEEASG